MWRKTLRWIALLACKCFFRNWDVYLHGSFSKWWMPENTYKGVHLKDVWESPFWEIPMLKYTQTHVLQKNYIVWSFLVMKKSFMNMVHPLFIHEHGSPFVQWLYIFFPWTWGPTPYHLHLRFPGIHALWSSKSPSHLGLRWRKLRRCLGYNISCWVVYHWIFLQHHCYTNRSSIKPMQLR